MNEKIDEIKLILPPPVAFVLDRLRGAGFPAYVVGGCVRDALMHRTPGDYDVTTAARPDDLVRVFSDCRVVETGLKHGTLTVVLDGMNVEVTTYRVDGSYSDGRRPDSVSFTDRLPDDLCRRDFTVNAMAWSPEDGLVDLFGGRDDIRRRTVRCVGNAADRFSEDGLRILRALRFASALDFSCDGECAAAVRSMSAMLDRISRERIHAELTKLLAGPAAGRVLAEFAPVAAHILPPLTEEQVRQAAARFAALPLLSAETGEEERVPTSVRYAVLLDSLTEPDAARVMSSLKPSREEKRAVLDLLARRDAVIPTDEPERARLCLLRLMRDTDDRFPATLALFLRLTDRIGGQQEEAVRSLAAALVARDECRRVSQLAVDGRILTDAGLRGEEIGETLRTLLELVMQGQVPNEKEALLKALPVLQNPEAVHG